MSLKKRLYALEERRTHLDIEIGRTTFGGYPAYSEEQDSAMRQERNLIQEEIETIEAQMFPSTSPNRGDLSYEDLEGFTRSESKSSFKGK